MKTHNIKFYDGKRKIKYYCNGKERICRKNIHSCKINNSNFSISRNYKIKFNKSAKPEKVDNYKK